MAAVKGVSTALSLFLSVMLFLNLFLRRFKCSKPPLIPTDEESLFILHF